MKKSAEWTRPDELEYLTNQAKKVPKNGHIVEIGTWKGFTTTALSKGAHHSVTIHTFDDYKLDIAGESAKLARREFYRDVLTIKRNIQLHETFSPPDEWNTPVNFIFIDAKRSLYKNIDFWYNLLAPDGILTGHDYNKENPDVVKIVNQWLTDNNRRMKLFKFIWRLL